MAFIQVQVPVLEHLLDLPHSMVITEIQYDATEGIIEIYVEDENLPLPEGNVPIAATYETDESVPGFRLVGFTGLDEDDTENDEG